MTDAGVPLFIRSLGDLDPATPADPVKYCEISVADTSIDERWLQQLLFRHPEVLPMTELDHAFAPPSGLSLANWRQGSAPWTCSALVLRDFSPLSRRNSIGTRSLGGKCLDRSWITAPN